MINSEIWLRNEKGVMTQKIGEACSLEMLAEETSELSQAALKLARVLRGINATPVTYDEAFSNLIEEFTDVYMCADDLNLTLDLDQMDEKLERFKERNGIKDEEI